MLQADGERLPLAVKDLGSCDIYPGSLVHSPNGRFVAVCGDGEYIIYTALAWRNKSYGAALSFVWGEDSNTFATRDSPSIVRWGAEMRRTWNNLCVETRHCDSTAACKLSFHPALCCAASAYHAKADLSLSASLPALLLLQPESTCTVQVHHMV